MDALDLLCRSQQLTDSQPTDIVLTEVSYQSLRYICGQRMFCQATGRCLDASRAVEISVWHASNCVKTTAVDVEVAQSVVERLLEVARRQTPWLTIAIIDGRLFTAQGMLRQRWRNNETKDAVKKLAETVIEHNRAAAAGGHVINKQLQLL